MKGLGLWGVEGSENPSWRSHQARPSSKTTSTQALATGLKKQIDFSSVEMLKKQWEKGIGDSVYIYLCSYLMYCTCIQYYYIYIYVIYIYMFNPNLEHHKWNMCSSDVNLWLFNLCRRLYLKQATIEVSLDKNPSKTNQYRT